MNDIGEYIEGLQERAIDKVFNDILYPIHEEVMTWIFYVMKDEVDMGVNPRAR